MDNIIEFVKTELSFDFSGHNYLHAIRVFNNAKKIIEHEGGNEKVILTSALIHDCVDKKLFNDIEKQNKKVETFLFSQQYTNDEITEIQYIINNISWNKGANVSLDSLNAMIVRDADRLDAIGAIGIIRTIEFGANRKRNFYDDANIKKTDNNNFEFNNISETTLSHFYEKLLLLKDALHTSTAKKLANKRHDFMLEFLKEFYSEL